MDIELKETGSGGDLVKTPKDLSVIRGFENMVYLGMFGGNVGFSTPSKRVDGEQDFSWWGNSLLFPDDPSVQFNSLTEDRLNNVALNSRGRLLIEEAVKRDLSFMSPFAEIKVDTAIIGVDKLAIGIQVTQLNNLQEREFVYIWDATNAELLDRDYVRKNPNSVPASADTGFDYTFNFDFT
jgi:hypothetical protein